MMRNARKGKKACLLCTTHWSIQPSFAKCCCGRRICVRFRRLYKVCQRGGLTLCTYTRFFSFFFHVERRRKPVRLAIKRSRQLPSPRDAIRAADLPSLFSSSRASCRPIKKCPVAQFGWEARRVCGSQPLRCWLVGLLAVLACWLRWVWGVCPSGGLALYVPSLPPLSLPRPQSHHTHMAHALRRSADIVSRTDTPRQDPTTPYSLFSHPLTQNTQDCARGLPFASPPACPRHGAVVGLSTTS